MRRKARSLLPVAALLLLAPSAFGAGFLLYEHGAAAMALAGAFTALAKDPSALWHNPAGLTGLAGTRLMAGATLISPRGSMTLEGYPGIPTYGQVHQVFVPPHIYATHRFSERVSAGLGVFSPFGLGIEWPDPETFPWRYLGTSGDMTTLMVNPAVAVKLNDRLSLGLGASFVHSRLRQSVTQIVNVGGKVFDAPTDIDADADGFGFNAGLLFRMDKSTLGLSYRSRISLKYAGDVSLDVPVYPEPFSGTFETSIRYPDIVTMGLAFELAPSLTWSVDLHYIFWTLFDETTAKIDVPDLGLTEEIVQTPSWESSYAARTGLEYRPGDRLALRAGFAYDQTPQPAATMDSLLPDANRLAFTAGFGYNFGRIVVDAAYQFESFRRRTSERGDLPALLQGTFKTRSHLIGISLGYRF